MVDQLWDPAGSILNLLTTQLDSLASGSLTVLGPEIDNTTLGWTLGRLRFHIASSSLALVSTSRVDVFFVPSNAGSNYPTITAGSSPKIATANYFAGSIQLFPATLSSATLDEYLDLVSIPQGKFKTALLYIGGGAAGLPSSGNTLDLIPTPLGYR